MTNEENHKEKQLPIDKQKYDDLIEQCLEIIHKYKILFITDLVAFLPFSRATFYFYQLDKSDTLKEAIEQNKILLKQSLRSKWFENPAPALQIALYKMIATPEERAAISNAPQFEKPEEKQEELPIKQLFESLKRSVKQND